MTQTARNILVTSINTANLTSLLLIEANFELQAIDGALPQELCLIPPGHVIQGRDGRVYKNDNPTGVVDYFNADGRDLPFDWNHATELKAPKGEEAPAAAWGKQGTMKAAADGSVFINIEWTPRGKESVLNKESRYISPVYLCDPETMQIKGISSVGLTNKPNLLLPALNQEKVKSKGESTMEEFIKQLAAILGLPTTATAAQVLAACKKEVNDDPQMNFEKNPPPLTMFVPRADFDATVTRAVNAEQSLKDRDTADLKKEANAAIDLALAAGKITPATKDYYLKQCNTKEGLANFQEFVKAAPAVADASTLDGKDPAKTETALNAEQSHIAGMFGNTAEDLKKYGGA